MCARQYCAACPRHAVLSVCIRSKMKAAACVVALLIIRKLRRRKRLKKTRQCWIRPLFQQRVKNLKVINYEIHYRTTQFLRLTLEEFEHIHTLVEPFIKKTDTHWRVAITTKERLAITLRYLATGDSYTSLQYIFHVSKQTISKIVPEVCDALVKALKDVIKLPVSEQDWKIVSKEFEEKWNFPHVIGALDGKHITIQAPFRSGTEYYNYKKYFSIVLLALVDSNYNFMYVNVGSQGRISDGGVFKHCELYRKLENNQLNVPAPEILNIPYTTKVPYVILGDQAFALTKYMLTPFAGIHSKGSKERIFNYRLSRARRVVENAFGILASKFRVLRNAIMLNPTSAKKVVLAAVHLHNFLRNSSSITTSNNSMNESVTLTPNECIGGTPTDIRNFLAEHFMANGSIIWQDRY
ncbi:putative nuclease HARBI1 [Maniola jurtina]|uniref:putative nuclease HARBI1 n=2 Tax=Nymphalidae TaxID=33415 RepID=UPI001E68656D|nr:putative nuclease HARBI1 [Maniola jurtina]XP_045778529.1 putative nuclease HARBI1 [Maniola jurtina]XP_045778530.1 putative nuclease HARBI1 [Maniola jurtina]XP_045782217.1 putative nuclease HARBI1 [Maniola jurtina]